MNIIIKNPSHYVSGIKTGGLFLFEDKVYIKTDNSFYDFNQNYHFDCVELSTGICKPFYIFTRITPLTIVKDLVVEKTKEGE